MFIPLKAAALSTLVATNAHANFTLDGGTEPTDDYHLLIG